MVGLKAWAKKHFGKDPLNIPKGDLKKDIKLMKRRSAVVRDEIEDADNHIKDLLKSSVGKSKEEKIAMASEIKSIKIKKSASQKKHQKLMADLGALYAIEGVVSLKDSIESTVLDSIMTQDIGEIMRVAEEAGIQIDVDTDSSMELADVLASSWGYDKVSDQETDEILNLMDEYEAGELSDEDIVEKVEEAKPKRKIVE